ncbi:hypothetical protein [Nocardioides sp.]|uniref:hypothetical protein n=1 Tax=Nocardioides sp. TaxID=35761 RepID=UPI0025E6C258|nr:hypothetical protein [Nocardioides sp.]
MTTELENVLARELHEVADGVRVPPMPALPTTEAPSATRRWQPLLVAAAAVLIVGVAALVLSQRDGGSVEPAPPGPTRITDPAAPDDTTISTAMPTAPFIVDGRLYVDGTEVPGERWWGLQSHGDVWLATQGSSGAWWWGGPGVDGGQLEGRFEQPPVLSPNGAFVAYVDVSSGRAEVNGFTTDPSGEGFGLPLTGLPRVEDGIPIRVRAVTDDGDVIVQGTQTSIMWRTQSGTELDTVDLSTTAPDQIVLQGTAAGLVVVDGSDGPTDAAETEPSLATIDPDGTLTPGAALPTYDALEVNPAGTWLFRAPAGTLGGDGPSIDSLLTQPVDGGDEVALDAPEGWGFVAFSWTWEDDETVLAGLVSQRRAGPVEYRLARCRVDLGECRAIPVSEPESAGGTATDAPRSFTAEQALDAVVGAVASGDRGSLLDQSVIDDPEWSQLVEFAAGQGGSAGTCRDNGGGTKDCEIALDADPATTYYAILTPGENGYGWRITYVSIGGA